MIEGVLHVRHRIRGHELECVLTAIMDAICILDARRRDSCTEVDIDKHWLHSHNADREESARASFYGLDLYSPYHRSARCSTTFRRASV